MSGVAPRSAAARRRAGLLAALTAATLAVPAPADAGMRGGRAHCRALVSDPDRALARMAACDRAAAWPAWEERRPLSSIWPPLTRERIAAPPLTGWGYGGTIPGALPGF